ncbi:MAG: DUF456 domain-containing protein [Syntrophaceae bacterium]
MSALAVTGLTVFILVLFVGLFSILSGLPGTLIILGAAVVYSAVTGFSVLGLKILGVLAIITVVSESLDVLFIMNGARGSGFTKSGLFASTFGGIAGAAVLTPFLFGLGAVTGILLGGTAANLTVEIFRQKHQKSLTYKNIFGSAARTLVKGVCGIAMVLIVLSEIYS